MSTLNLIFKFMTSFGSKAETHMTPDLMILNKRGIYSATQAYKH